MVKTRIIAFIYFTDSYIRTWPIEGGEGGGGVTEWKESFRSSFSRQNVTLFRPARRLLAIAIAMSQCFCFVFLWQCIYLLFCNDKSTIIKIFVCHLGTKSFNLILLRRNSGISLKKIALWPRKNIRKACEIFGARRVPFMLNSLFSFIQRIKRRMACLLLISNKAIFRLQNTQSLMTIAGEQWNKCGTIHSFCYLNR